MCWCVYFLSGECKINRNLQLDRRENNLYNTSLQREVYGSFRILVCGWQIKYKQIMDSSKS